MIGVHHYLSSEHKHRRGPAQSMLLIQEQLQLRKYNEKANGFRLYIFTICSNQLNISIRCRGNQSKKTHRKKLLEHVRASIVCACGQSVQGKIWLLPGNFGTKIFLLNFNDKPLKLKIPFIQVNLQCLECLETKS